MKIAQANPYLRPWVSPSWHIQVLERHHVSILDRIDTAFVADLDCNTDKVILTAFARHADESGACWLAKRTLAEYTRRSEDAVYRALRRLEAAGAIVRVAMHDPSWHGVQRSNGYILTAVADTPEKLEAAKIDMTSRRWREGEDRVGAGVRTASARPLEVIPKSGSNQPTTREIGESGAAAPFSESGGVELQLQQPSDAATQDEAAPTTANDTSTTPDLPSALNQAWLDTFGELTDKQRGFISNAARTYSATEVLRALGLAAGQLEKGQEIARPAAYVKTILTRKMNEIGAGHRAAKQQPATGHRNQVDWAAVAEGTSQATPEGVRGTHADPDRIEQETAEERAGLQQRIAERKERERIAAEQKQIDQERRNQAAVAAYAERQRRDVANLVTAVTGCSTEAALSVADEFFGAVAITKLQETRLDYLTIHRNKVGSVSIDTARRLLVHGPLSAVAKGSDL